MTNEQRIKLIKWSCENGYADGFGVVERENDFAIVSPDWKQHPILTEENHYTMIDDNCAYPLFLQRTRIGINKRYMDNNENGGDPYIDAEPGKICISYKKPRSLYNYRDFWLSDYDGSEEKALEAALFWLMEEMKK